MTDAVSKAPSPDKAPLSWRLLSLAAVSGACSLSVFLLLRRLKQAREEATEEEEEHVVEVYLDPDLQNQEPSSPSKATSKEEETHSPEEKEWANELFTKAAAGSVDEVKKLLQTCPAAEGHTLRDLVNMAFHLPHTNWVFLTPLGVSVVHGHVEVLRALLEAQADPEIKCQNVSSWDGAFTLTRTETPLCIAAQENHVDLVHLLATSGVGLDILSSSEYLEGSVEWGEDDDGSEVMYYTALDSALAKGLDALASELSKLGAKRSSELLEKPKNRPRRKMISQGSRMGA